MAGAPRSSSLAQMQIDYIFLAARLEHLHRHNPQRQGEDDSGALPVAIGDKEKQRMHDQPTGAGQQWP